MTVKFYDVNAEEDKDGEKPDLGVYEARQLNKRYSDDTWHLQSYTSELRNNNEDSFFAFVDFNDDGEGIIRECPHCLEFEIHNKLGPKILKEGEKPAPDNDKWLSCYSCGRTFAAHETFAESKIKDSVETTDNPFENESIFLCTDNRATQRRKGKKRKGRFSSKYEDKDSDIQSEIDRHLTNGNSAFWLRCMRVRYVESPRNNLLLAHREELELYLVRSLRQVPSWQRWQLMPKKYLTIPFW